MTCHWVCNYKNTTSATSGAETICPSESPEFPPVFSGVRVTPDYPFCIFKLLLNHFLSFLLAVRVPDKLYSGHASCTLNQIYTYLLFMYFIFICEHVFKMNIAEIVTLDNKLQSINALDHLYIYMWFSSCTVVILNINIITECLLFY